MAATLAWDEVFSTAGALSPIEIDRWRRGCYPGPRPAVLKSGVFVIALH